MSYLVLLSVLYVSMLRTAMLPDHVYIHTKIYKELVLPIVTGDENLGRSKEGNCK